MKLFIKQLVIPVCLIVLMNSRPLFSMESANNMKFKGLFITTGTSFTTFSGRSDKDKEGVPLYFLSINYDGEFIGSLKDKDLLTLDILIGFRFLQINAKNKDPDPSTAIKNIERSDGFALNGGTRINIWFNQRSKVFIVGLFDAEKPTTKIVNNAIITKVYVGLGIFYDDIADERVAVTLEGGFLRNTLFKEDGAIDRFYFRPSLLFKAFDKKGQFPTYISGIYENGAHGSESLGIEVGQRFTFDL